MDNRRGTENIMHLAWDAENTKRRNKQTLVQHKTSRNELYNFWEEQRSRSYHTENRKPGPTTPCCPFQRLWSFWTAVKRETSNGGGCRNLPLNTSERWHTLPSLISKTNRPKRENKIFASELETCATAWARRTDDDCAASSDEPNGSIITVRHVMLEW